MVPKDPELTSASIQPYVDFTVALRTLEAQEKTIRQHCFGARLSKTKCVGPSLILSTSHPLEPTGIGA